MRAETGTDSVISGRWHELDQRLRLHATTRNGAHACNNFREKSKGNTDMEAAAELITCVCHSGNQSASACQGQVESPTLFVLLSLVCAGVF